MENKNHYIFYSGNFLSNTDGREVLGALFFATIHFSLSDNIFNRKGL